MQVRASFWFLICSFLQKSISTITTPIFTRLLTTAEYGQFNVFNSWLSIITVFVTLRLYYGFYGQGLIKYEERRDQLSSSMQGLVLTLILAWTAIYLLFRDFWNRCFSLTTVQMLAMLLMIWATAAFDFWAAEQRVKLNYKRLVGITLFISAAKPLVGILFVTHAEDKVTARILGLALVELLGYTALFVSQMKRGRRFFDAQFWKYALLFNLPLIPHYLSQTALNSADRIMISSMVSEDAAGIYSLAYSVSMIMMLFNTALSQTITPWMYQKIKDKREEDTAKTVYGTLILIAVVNVILIAFAPEAVSIFAPKSYHDAIWVIPPVAMSVYFIFTYDIFAKYEFYYEKTRFIMVASVAAAALNVILNYVFIGMFGYYAAGYTTLFCYVVYAIGHYSFMRKICNEHVGKKKIYDVKALLTITLSFVGIGFLFLITYQYLIARYCLIVILLAVIVIKRNALVSTVKQLVESKKGSKSKSV